MIMVRSSGGLPLPPPAGVPKGSSMGGIVAYPRMAQKARFSPGNWPAMWKAKPPECVSCFQCAAAVQFEIGGAGVVGDLPRRHRHRQQADTRQLQVDQVADVLHRADLGLLREVPAQALAGDVGAHHQDEAGVVDQAAVAEHRDVHAVGLLDDRDGDRLGVDHRRQRLAQGEHHRGEAGGQVVVVVHRVLLRTPLAGGEGTELAGQGHQFAVQLLRVQRAHAGQVTGEGLGAVDQLQQQEVGDFRGAPGAGCHHPPGEGFAALVEQAQQLLGEGRQGGAAAMSSTGGR